MSFQSALFFDNDLGHCVRFAPWSNKITPFHIGGIESKVVGIVKIDPALSACLGKNDRERRICILYDK